MLEEIKEYINKIDFKGLTLAELKNYTEIIILINQAELNEKAKQKMLDELNKAREGLK